MPPIICTYTASSIRPPPPAPAAYAVVISLLFNQKHVNSVLLYAAQLSFLMLSKIYSAPFLKI